MMSCSRLVNKRPVRTLAARSMQRCASNYNGMPGMPRIWNCAPKNSRWRMDASASWIGAKPCMWPGLRHPPATGNRRRRKNWQRASWDCVPRTPSARGNVTFPIWKRSLSNSRRLRFLTIALTSTTRWYKLRVWLTRRRRRIASSHWSCWGTTSPAKHWKSAVKTANRWR